jgi:lysine-N-methylase
MRATRIEIPTIQNWSCHGCTECCRSRFLVKISGEEEKRIGKQNWTQADGVDPATMFVRERDHVRLAHQGNGACVFLDSSGRCRIHSKWGEPAKPLACRLYPLVINPVGGQLVAGLRFSCPSAAANLGKPLVERASELRSLAGEVVPKGFVEGAPPAVVATLGGDWADFRRFIKWIDVSMSTNGVPVALSLLRTLHWLKAIEKGRLDHIAGEGAEEILAVLNQSAREKVPTLAAAVRAPSRFGRVFFRMMVMEHARVVTVDDMNSPWRHRWAMLRAIMRFLSAKGHTPALRENLKSVKFSQVETFPGPVPAEADAALRRFFRVKIQSLQFCGRAFHNASLVEGFRSLALLYPTIIWLARWSAVSDGRGQISEGDVTSAITAVDYHHGYLPSPRWRVRLLAQRDDIARLCVWYAR